MTGTYQHAHMPSMRQSHPYVLYMISGNPRFVPYLQSCFIRTIAPVPENNTTTPATIKNTNKQKIQQKNNNQIKNSKDTSKLSGCNSIYKPNKVRIMFLILAKYCSYIQMAGARRCGRNPCWNLFLHHKGLSKFRTTSGLCTIWPTQLSIKFVPVSLTLQAQ